jgi:hypothetical protein
VILKLYKRTSMSELIAHIKQDEKGNWVKHILPEHSAGVADLAGHFADEFGNGDWARAAARQGGAHV